MFKTMFAMFLIFHVLGDFYAQPDKLAAGKREKYGYVLLHSGIYTIVFFAAACLTWFFRAVWFAAALSLAHFLIDSLKHIMRKSVEKKGKGTFSSILPTSFSILPRLPQQPPRRSI